ncbi:DUF6708 domain-containing protein [Acinetobacter colistiniresistens]|uniref:DUF6708 domain-containing protein n=1 Tax=Acinetobacter colistiniresistens TaxID=280145 RepID=S3UDE8_9GAMM|nr:DUF6708 domain-containing protein [Acinetobacter colistiniresistens]EPG37512.1 hypothetical protein F907_01481 [Acinetobacter colistiniresistens]TVT86981.1 hypothetical protein FPV60_01910 [Acinetobacter colistiniresistens]
MLREDYETKFTTLNQPFEIGIPNKNGRLRLREIDIKSLKTDQLYPHRKVIRFNSTFMEVMDSWEFIRGRATALALPMWAVCIFGLILFSIMATDGWLDKVYWFTLFIFMISLGVLYIIYSNYKMAKYDLFGYTHYPIRFNRKAQKVYAFSPQQQKIIELNWQDLRFSAVQEGRFDIELRASLVNADNIVEEEIIFPFITKIYGKELVDQHLAFFKAYMQGYDLKSIDAAIPEFFDVYNRKESFKESFERVYMQFDGEEIIQQTRPAERDNGIATVAFALFPLIILRRLGLYFSKIPQWPTHIEKECQIESNDPYDSTGKQRHLAPLVFTSTEKFILFLGWFLGTSIFIAFLAGLAYLSWNYR